MPEVSDDLGDFSGLLPKTNSSEDLGEYGRLVPSAPTAGNDLGDYGRLVPAPVTVVTGTKTPQTDQVVGDTIKAVEATGFLRGPIASTFLKYKDTGIPNEAAQAVFRAPLDLTGATAVGKLAGVIAPGNPITQVQEGVMDVGGDFLASAVTPQNVALLGAGGALGKLGTVLLSAGFEAHALRNAPEQYNQFKEALAKGDYQNATRIGGNMAVGIGLPVAAVAIHGAQGKPVESSKSEPATLSRPPQENALQEVSRPLEGTTESVAASPETPTPQGVAPKQTGGASVPVMMTRKMEADLRSMGYEQPAIDRMTPQQANDILNPPAPEVSQAPVESGLSAKPEVNKLAEEMGLRYEGESLGGRGVAFTDTKTGSTLDFPAEITPDNLRSQVEASRSQFEPKSATSIKNEVVDQQRMARGELPRMEPARKSNQQAWDEAMKLIEENPNHASDLVDAIRDRKKTAVNEVDQQALLHEQIRVRNERDFQADRAADPLLSADERALASERFKQIENRVNEIDQATDISGTMAGRALQIRQQMMHDDFSPAGIERQIKVAKGEPLTQGEVSFAKAESAKIAKEQKAFTDRAAEIQAKAELKVLFKDLVETSKAEAQQAKAAKRGIGDFIEEQANKARARIKARGGRLSTGLDPIDLADHAIIGASYIAKGAAKFSDWSARMVKDFGEAVKPYLKDLYARARELHSANSKVFTSDERRMAATKKRLAKQVVTLDEKIARAEAGDTTVFEKTLRVPFDISKDPVAMSLKAKLEKSKQDFAKELRRYKLERRSVTRKIVDGIAQTFNASKNIVSSFDFSAPRQALPAMLGNATRLLTKPGMIFRPFRDMFKGWASEGLARRTEQEIHNRPNAKNGLDKQAKIEYSALDETSFTKQEENVRSVLDEWAELPLRTGKVGKTAATLAPKLLARGVRMSNRAFITFLNRTRADLFDHLLKTNFKNRAPTAVELEALGNLVNVATGRGKMRPMTQTVLSTFLWSPKLLGSRIQMLAGQPFYRGTAMTRKIVLKEYARMLASGYALWKVAQLFSDKESEDSRSSDLGKIVLGDTRIDLWGGLQQPLVLEERIRTGQTTTIGGKTLNLRDRTEDGVLTEPLLGQTGYSTKKGYGQDILNTSVRFVRSKLRPDVGAGVDWIVGENVIGEKTTPASIAESLAVPLSFRDILPLMEEQGVPRGVGIELLQQFGAGVSTYSDEGKVKEGQR